MKTILAILSAVILFSTASFAADTASVNPQNYVPIINSTLNAQAYVTNGLYPLTISATTATNVVAIPLGKTKDLAIQFNGQLYQNSATAIATNSPAGTVTLQLGRNVQGGCATNAMGTGLNIEWVGTLTTSIATNLSTGTFMLDTNFSDNTGTGTLGGALGSAYVGWITASTYVTLTNYQVYVNLK